ncbi:hypothetical protein QN219_12115 [Sinorhizobium sp. 7-81]|uniref:hypothetical protein n=1 Tax=Sinorhizobium sp. 8-89 TaxID=3049089 RepID=UPI0024C468F8|nr:hypothetical protein [Sinorhizobium sp. 8-89]MDK1490807.1 hypothetical protein [Sinorhizobium sp. 8-89]
MEYRKDRLRTFRGKLQTALGCPCALNLMLQLLFLMPSFRVEHSRESEVCTLRRAHHAAVIKVEQEEEEVMDEGTFATQACWSFVSISDRTSSGAL